MSNELITQIDTQNIIVQRERALDLAMRGYALLVEAEVLARSTKISGVAEALAEHFRYGSLRLDPKDVPRLEESMRRKLDASAWNSLVRGSGLYAFMDEKARKEWEQTFKTNMNPAFEPEAIQAAIENLCDTRGSMLVEDIGWLYRNMSWDKARACATPMGMKARLEGFTSTYSSGLGYGAERMQSLVRILCILDGKRPDLKKIEDEIADGYRNNREGSRAFGNDYFDVRFYKNGVAHIVFKREDLLAKLNELAVNGVPAQLTEQAA